MTNIVKNTTKKGNFPILDDTDRKLISHLQEDGRMSFVKLATLMGVTEGTIRRKYKKLVKEGALKITAISNPYAIGFDAPAFIGINVERRLLENVAEKLSKMPEVQFVAVTTGTYEIIIQVISFSNKNLYDLIMKIGEIEGIQNTHTFLMLNIHKHSWSFTAESVP
jgi:Lrp/AsnC family transcriptional regulator for asnA, asnC and gidA